MASYGLEAPFEGTSRRVRRKAEMATIGIIGAGHIGSQIARLAVKNGYDVVISNSRGPETLAGLVRNSDLKLGPEVPLKRQERGISSWSRYP